MEKATFDQVWKTVKLGTGLQTAEDFRRAFRNDGIRIGNWADDILGRPAFTVATKETELELVKVSVAELGFKDGACREDIYKQALRSGLELCPNEVGPQLRLQYKDQPRGEWILIAMEPIAGSDGGLSVFFVERDGRGLWLSGSCGSPVSVWSSHSQWVFARRKLALGSLEH